MKRLFSTAASFFLLTASVFAITTQEEQLIVENVRAVLGQTVLELPDTIPVKRICGTATLMEAKQRFNELSPSAQRALSPALFARPVLQKSYDPPSIFLPSGRFRIHFDTTGSGAVRNAGIDLRGGIGSFVPNGIPDWVDTLGFVLDSIWNKEVIQLGFLEPVSDGFYTPNGGNGLFDVYLDELGGAILGYTAPDSAGGVLGNRATAYIVLDNDYAGIPGYTDPDGPRRAIRVTAAHEFFHAVQFAYTVFGAEVVNSDVNPYWYEASAVWMEDQVYNEINDYLQYLPFWFDAPELSFRSFSDNFGFDPYRAFRPYALGIYGQYLSKRFPNPSYGYSVVRRVWEQMATVTGFNLFSALDAALAPMGYNFISSLQEFYRWNYFVGSKVPLNAPDTLYGSEAAAWPTFELFDQVDSTSNYPTQFPQVHIPCGLCDPASISFFCSPCTINSVGFPCSTKCPPICRFVPYQPTSPSVINCVNDLEDLGASYLNLQNPGGGSFIEFELVSDTSRPAPWFASAVGYDTDNRTYTFLTGQPTDPSGRIPKIFFSEFGNYTEIVVMVTNSELLASGAARQNSAFAYSTNVDSAAPPGITQVVEGRPNPFRTQIDPYVKFPIDLDSLSGTWDVNLLVFSTSGEIVYKKTYELQGGFPHSNTVTWAGRNGSNEPVASGVYFCKIIMKEKGTSRKVEKVSKIALIR